MHAHAHACMQPCENACRCARTLSGTDPCTLPTQQQQKKRTGLHARPGHAHVHEQYLHGLQELLRGAGSQAHICASGWQPVAALHVN